MGQGMWDDVVVYSEYGQVDLRGGRGEGMGGDATGSSICLRR